MKAKLRYRAHSSGLQLGFKLHRFEDIEQRDYSMVLEALEAETNVPVYGAHGAEQKQFSL